jgi:3'(2'), 5'-bisphosphate nucleotidase
VTSVPDLEFHLSTPLEDDLLARDLAATAGERLLALRAGWPDDGATGSDGLRAAGDQQSHAFLAAELARLRPADAVLSEEAADDGARLAAERVWIIDPLDGTREFGETGRADWAVHVALGERGELTAGAVALPAAGRVVSTAELRYSKPQGSDAGDRVAGDRVAGDRVHGDRLRLLISRSRPPEFVHRLAEQLDAELVPMGSAGAKAAAVIAGEADAYVHSGGQYEWDSAAPVAVARAAGLHASRIDGSSLRYNQADPAIPDILISQAELAPALLAAIGTAQRAVDAR